MAGNEPVTSPDQHKPGASRSARVGAVITAAILLAMLLGNHRGWVENVWLIAGAVLLVLVLVADWVLRKNGLRS